MEAASWNIFQKDILYREAMLMLVLLSDSQAVMPFSALRAAQLRREGALLISPGILCGILL